MKIYAISFVKNESDIIAENLLAASIWADKIFVFDNGSTDSTWEIVNGLASEKIIPYKYSNIPFRDSLRQEVFEFFRGELNDGDWVCFRLDADEFYRDDPRTFLVKQPKYVSLVKGVAIEFQFTVDNMNKQNDLFNPADFEYCRIENFEERFFKYRKKLTWNSNDSIPKHPGVTSTKMIKFAHYQYRSKNQIMTRLKTRNQAIESGFSGYWKADLKSGWEKKIIDKDKLIRIKNLDEANGFIDRLVIQNKESIFRRIIKRVMHGCKFWP